MVSAGRIRNSSPVYEPLPPPFCPRGANKAHYIIHAFVDNSSGCRPAPLAQRTPRFGVTNLALKLISDSGSSLGKPPVLPVSLPVRKALPSDDGMRDSLPRPGGRCAVFGAPGATVSGTASGDQSHGLSTRHAALFFLPSGSTDRASCWSTRLDSAAGNLPRAGERKGDPVTPSAARCRGGLAVDTCQPTAYAIL